MKLRRLFAFGIRTMALLLLVQVSRVFVFFLIQGSNKGKTKSKTPIPSLKKPQAF